jgi:hypothetical protein
MMQPTLFSPMLAVVLQVIFSFPLLTLPLVILQTPNATVLFLISAKHSAPLLPPLPKPKPAVVFSMPEMLSPFARSSKKWDTRNLSLVLLLKPTIPQHMASSTPRFAWNNQKRLICAITGCAIASPRSNSICTGLSGNSTVLIISPSTTCLPITNFCATFIYRKLLKPHPSRLPCEGMFLPPGLIPGSILHRWREDLSSRLSLTTYLINLLSCFYWLHSHVVTYENSDKKGWG